MVIPDEVADVARKRRALQQQFAAQAETTIVGAVGAAGPGAARSPPESLWTLHLRLVAWRELGQPVRVKPLIVSKLIDDAELKAFQNGIRSQPIVAFRAKLVVDNPFGNACAELLSLIPGHVDRELSDFLVEYAKPVRMVDPQFGTFELNKAIEWFEGKATWCGVPVTLAICPDNGKPDAALLAAKQLWRDMTAWAQKITAYAVAELLDVKNDYWRGAREAALSAEQFASALRLELITVYADGHFEFWFDDGNLFRGHAVTVSGSLDMGLTDANIAG